MYSLAAQTGSGNSGAASSDQSFQVSGNTMGGLYTVMSKTIFNKTAVHMGYLYSLKKTGLVSLDYSQLLPFLDSNLQNDLINDGASPRRAFFIPVLTLIFWGRNWKFEIWKPIGLDKKPILFNTQIDGLPLAFNLGYMRWETGFALLGYVNVPITLFPSVPAY